MVATSVSKPLTQAELKIAAERQRRLVAAMAARGVNQAELHRLLVAHGERFAVSTISNWCRGASHLSEVTLRGILSILDLPPSWQPTDPPRTDG